MPALQVVFCRMSPLQQSLYNFFLSHPAVCRALGVAAVRMGERKQKRERVVAKEAAAGTKPARKAAGGKNKKGSAAAAAAEAAEEQEEEAIDLTDDAPQAAVPPQKQKAGRAGTKGAADASAGAISGDGPDSAGESDGGGAAIGKGGSAAGAGAGGAQPLSTLAAITALKKMCCHPDLVSQVDRA